jgi:transposase InsO family protein
VFKELSKMEQRYDAVLGVIRDGFSVTEVAKKFGVSRQTMHVWLARYEEGGLDALSDRSHRPVHSPGQMAPDAEARVLELRRHHPSWGQIRLEHELTREGFDPVPSASSIYRALRRAGLVNKSKRKTLPTYKRWERAHPMELWQMDVVGGVLLADGTECKILTGIDDHSRFMVCAGIMTRAISAQVCGHLAAALKKYGAPEEILTDNGKVFTNRFGLTPTEVLFDRILRENGINHLLTAPFSPTTTGKVERFHRTLRHEFLTARVFSSLEVAQRELDDCIDDYNTKRPHQSLKMATPATRFYERGHQGPKPTLDLSALENRSGDDWVSRTISINGIISISNQVFSCGKQRSGHLVDVHVLDTLLQVWDGDELIKTVPRTTKGEIRKKKAEPHRKRIK